MKKADFAACAEQRGLRVVNNIAYGVVGNYPVQVQLVQDANLQVVVSLEEGGEGLDKTSSKEIVKEIRGELQVKATVSLHNGRLTALVGNPWGKAKKVEEGLDDLLSVLPAVLHRRGISPQKTCPICHREDCEMLAAFDGSYQPIHQGCLEEIAQAAGQKMAQNQESGSYLTGLLGAIIGGLLATIPAVAVIWFTETAYSLLYFLIPLGVYHGYRLARGKMDGIVLPLTCVLSVVFGVATDIMNLAISMVANEIPLKYLGVMFTNGEVQRLLMGDMVSSLLFVALGIAVTWNQISRTARSSMDDALAIQQSAMVNPLAGQDANRY